MSPLFTVRGYTADDPLDRFSSSQRFLLTAGVTFLVALLFNYIQTNPIPVIRYKYDWMVIGGAVLMTVVMAPILSFLRKSSSLVFYFIVVAVAVPIDLYLEGAIRSQGGTALWMYNEGTFISAITILPLRFFVAWSFDGVILGALSLWCTRVVANALRRRRGDDPTRAQQEALFPDEWTKEEVAKPSRGIESWILRLLALGYLAYLVFLLLGFLGANSWPPAARNMLDMAFANPALLVNTFSKISLMILLGLIGAYNRHVRWYSTLIMAIGHVVSTVASLGFYYADPPMTPYRDFLMTSAIVDGLLVLLFLWIMFRSRKERKMFQQDREFPEMYSVPARLSRIAYHAIGVLLLLFIPLALFYRLWTDGTTGLCAVFGFPDPMLCNTLTMASTMSALGFILAEREKLRSYLFGVLLFGFMVTVLVTVPWLLFGNPVIETRGWGQVLVFSYFVLSVVVDGSTVILLLALRKMMYNVDYVITALNPSSAKNVLGLHASLFGGSTESSAATLQLIDKYVSGIRGRKRGLLNFPFWLIEHVFSTIYGLHPNFSTMSTEEGRYFLRKYMLRLPRERARALVPPLADVAFELGMASYFLVTNAHFSYVNSRKEVGFVPPDARDRLQADLSLYPPPFKSVARLPRDYSDPANFKRPSQTRKDPLLAPRVSTPVGEPSVPDEVDYLIAGSGAGGATMAYRLACQVDHPDNILVVERGNRYSPLQDFNDNEIEMTQKLFKEGGLQLTKRFDMIIAQGECVGGTTVINNAVCFPMPKQGQSVWETDYNIDLSDIEKEYQQIEKELDIQPLTDQSINQVVKKKFIKGVKAYNKSVSKDERLMLDPTLSVNYRNELGDGLWNLGNKRLRKRSMLETYIPWSEARGVRVVSNMTVVCLLNSGRRVDRVLLRSTTGDLRTVKVRKAVILSGGVIASSHMLMRSGLFGNVGRNVSCNFAFPLAFDFPDTLNAYDGTQIMHAAEDPKNRAVFETYFNPPAAFALSVPFFFNRRQSAMERYSHMVNFGALVGSEPNGRIQRKATIIDGRPITWELGETDRRKIKYALNTLLRIGYGAGAERALIMTRPGIELKLTEPNLIRFADALSSYPLRMDDVFFFTAHPQGGNGMAGDGAKFANQRVVNGKYQVDGWENVYVADASLFPTGITVNPQWTIMALSSLAAKSVMEQTA